LLTAKYAVITLVESPVVCDLDMGCAEFSENELQGVPRANEVGRKGAVEEKTIRFDASPGGARFFHPFEAEIGVFPAGEKVLIIPLALAVSQQHENAIHVSTWLDVCRPSNPILRSTSYIRYLECINSRTETAAEVWLLRTFSEFEAAAPWST
jgi:hypothetical protein